MGDVVVRLQSPEEELLEQLPDKRAQVKAALTKCHGLPFAVIGSDTHPKLMGIWCDNGLAGVGQVAIVTREFHEGQAEALCTLANSATAIPTLIDEIEALRAENARLRGCVLAAAEDYHWLADNAPDALGWEGHGHHGGPYPIAGKKAQRFQSIVKGTDT